MKKMQVTIHKDGTQRIEVLGAEGKTCIEFTHGLEKRLGIPIGERELKPEYYETEAESEVERDLEAGR
ncbi:MAG: DUF2997 domain-containing protein [Candidatus Hydrogenedens sp.]|nr:DUF2997 domain-containing protein [Candidatus Hydrogenedens sp.]